MDDNALIAAIVCVSIASCTALNLANRIHPEDATIVCVRSAWTNTDRVECLKAGKPPKGAP